MRKIPLAFWSRHLIIALRYGTPIKFANLARSYWHYVKGSPQIPTKPSFLKVEISRCCYVKCLGCLEKKQEIFYPFLLYKALIDKLKEYLFEVSLYDIGEPLHSKDIINYIKYAHLHGIGTIISTSLSLCKPEEFWKDLVLSGLDRLVVSIDGISKEVYNTYRTCGDLSLVLSNLSKIQSYRAQYKNSMFIEWQMIDLPWNKHEQRAARRLAQELGCESFRLIADSSQRLKYEQENAPRRRNCLLPFIILIVNAFNQVRPCYKIYGGNPILGDLGLSTFEEIWNGEEIARIRDKSKIKEREYCRTCRE